MSRDDQGQAGTSGRRVPVASLVVKGQARARCPEASGKGFHIGATRPRPAGRQDGGHHGPHNGVTTRAFGRRRPPFVRIACTSCPPSNWPCGIPSRLTFGERTRASINRTSHHLSKGRIIRITINHTSSPSSRTPLLRRHFFSSICSSSAYKAIHQTTLE